MVAWIMEGFHPRHFELRNRDIHESWVLLQHSEKSAIVGVSDRLKHARFNRFNAQIRNGKV